MQVRHAMHPEKLVQTDFPDIAQANAELDSFVSANCHRYSEARLVGKFVIRQIRYVTDYENWCNVEYWPTATEVWQRRQEDCDGRAILAASLLRSRGFRSAQLTVGLDHMWVIVDENEKDASKPPHYVALLNPNPDFSLEWNDSPRGSDLLRLARAFLHPTALRTTSTHLFADLPPLRKALLVTAFLLLCYHPCRQRSGLLLILAGGLAAVLLLGDWHPGEEVVMRVMTGGLVLLVSALAAIAAGRLHRLSAARLSRSSTVPSFAVPAQAPPG